MQLSVGRAKAKIAQARKERAYRDSTRKRRASVDGRYSFKNSNFFARNAGQEQHH